MDIYSAFFESFISVLRKFHKLGKSARDFGTGELLYPLEIHVIDVIGRNNELKMLDLVQKMGITKGAVSQVIKKLVSKGYVIKFMEEGNSRSIYLKLRSKGEIIFNEHIKVEHQIIEKASEVLKQIPEKEIRILLETFKLLEDEFDKHSKQG